MKNKIFLTVLIALMLLGKINAQNNEQEAQLAYQLAKEEYDKSNYLEAIKYLDKVQKLNPASYSKVSYLEAKCYDKQLTLTPDYDKLMNNLMVYIRYYLENGKDEDKKTELTKIKIKIESSDDYKIFKEFEHISIKDAFQMLVEAQKKFPNGGNIEGYPNIYSTIRLNDRNLNIFNANKQIKPTNFNSAGTIVLTVYKLDLMKNKILKINGQYVLETPIDRYDEVDYKNENKFRQYVEVDISNYLLYKYESHGKHEFRYTLLNNQWSNNNIIKIEGLLYRIYDQKKAGDNYNKRMILALTALFRK
jgi:hypothetical protein